MFKILKNILQAFGVFVGSFLLIHVAASSFYPVGADGYLQAPNSYPLILMGISTALTVLSFKTPQAKHKKQGSLFERIQEKKRLEAMTDVEKWQLEQQATKCGRQNANTTIEVDSLTDIAAKVIFETQQASVSMIQRRLNLGYARAAHIMNQLESVGVVSAQAENTPRRILMRRAEYEARKKIVDPQDFASDDVARPRNYAVNTFAKYGGLDAELLTIDLMEGHDFEHWCAALLERLGFSEVSVTPGSGDHGVDVLAKKDGIKYAVQCKCYSSDLGNKPVQEVHAGKAMYNCHVGAVMTNRRFTAGGRQLAEATGVLLWDRDWIISALQKVQ